MLREEYIVKCYLSYSYLYNNPKEVGYSFNGDSTYVFCSILLFIVPEFLVVHCPILEIPANGNIARNNTEYLTEVTYTCDVGYELNTTNDTKFCQSSGKWNPEEDVACLSKLTRLKCFNQTYNRILLSICLHMICL